MMFCMFAATIVGMGAYWARLRSQWCPFCSPRRTRATIIDPLMARDWELKWER